MTGAFAFRAVDAAGRSQKGVEEGSDPKAVLDALARRGMVVLELVPTDSGTTSASAPRGTRRQEVLEFTRAMAALLPAGLPLARALSAAALLSNGELAVTIGAIKSRVERGEPLAATLAQHHSLFPPLYIGLVRAGERSGRLAESFERLARHLERDGELRARLISAAIYPALLAAAGGVAVCALLFFVLPRFADLLSDAGAALPASTRLMLDLASLLRRSWPFLLVLPLAIGGLLSWTRRSETGRETAARLWLRLPLIAALRRQALGARFARLLGILLGGGAPLLTALGDVGECLADPLARRDAERIRGRVREGVALRVAVDEGGLYPPILGRLVGVGEQTGRMSEFLLKAADLLEERTERTTQRLAALAEPVMIVFFGLVVGGVALALLQAIYGMNTGTFR